MTQPQQQQVSMLVCADCGSVRVPVPAITSKIVVLNVPPTVTAPCPVCSVTKIVRDAMAAAAEEPEPAEELAELKRRLAEMGEEVNRLNRKDEQS